MTNATYNQSTGRFLIYDAPDETANERVLHDAQGYAGRGHGRNKPHLETVRNVGPLPRGFYRVTGPTTHPRLGPLAFRLLPFGTTKMHGRSGFYIHGDNVTNDASRGCIILSRRDREAVEFYGVKTLEVVPDWNSALAGTGTRA